MKKKIIVILCTLIGIVGLYILSSGFKKDGSAFLGDYSVSEDGSVMTVEVGVSSSVGFIRKVAVNHETEGVMCLDLYSAFGGFNGSIGAKSTYQIPLSKDANTICVYKNKGTYESVLVKDENSNWNRLGFEDREEYK